jgi:hypothetical protein
VPDNARASDSVADPAASQAVASSAQSERPAADESPALPEELRPRPFPITDADVPPLTPPGVRLPDYPDRSSITASMKRISGRLASCVDSSHVTSPVTLSLHIRPDGSADRISAGDVPPALANCLANVVAKTSFDQSRVGITTRFPIIIR